MKGFLYEEKEETKESEESTEPEESVNINTASHEDLQEITHISEARADEIIEIRPFETH